MTELKPPGEAMLIAIQEARAKGFCHAIGTLAWTLSFMHLSEGHQALFDELVSISDDYEELPEEETPPGWILDALDSALDVLEVELPNSNGSADTVATSPLN